MGRSRERINVRFAIISAAKRRDLDLNLPVFTTGLLATKREVGECGNARRNIHSSKNGVAVATVNHCHANA